MILAIETSTNVCSVALQAEESDVVERRTEHKGSHSEQLFRFIQELMEKYAFSISDLEGVLVSEGPGSYTGLRIGAGAVKGLLFGTDTPLFTVNTLAGFAEAVYAGTPVRGIVHAVIDARRKHLYHQEFITEEGALTGRSDAKVLPIREIQSLIKKGDTIIGTGINRLDQSVLKEVKVFGQDHISARSLINLYNKGERDFVTRTDADSYDPRYYTSNQVNER